METEQPTNEELGVFHKDNVRYKTMEEINEAIANLLFSIKDNYCNFEEDHDWRGLPREPYQTIGRLLDCQKDEVMKAEELLDRLSSEMGEISRIINAQIIVPISDSDSSGAEAEYDIDKMIKEEFMDQIFEGDVSYDTWEDMKEYSQKLQHTLMVVARIFGIFMAKAMQMKDFWSQIKTNPVTPQMIMVKLAKEMIEGTDEGNHLFHGILAKRLENFGIDEVEDILDEFVDSKEYEMREAEKERKESEAEEALKIAQEAFKEVFDGLKMELDELKVESEELRGELAALKTGGRG
ncbi:hypothetical protein V491_05992 [Pseudogymnoascus sp. VKM F-3775]|nr:hypothetical protein V491_05992 [Pseudogymnoascus sp. VKM F-3775]